MNKTILLVTSGQPSLNPRLVKEADALAKAGYEVTVLYSYWNEWGTALDQKLLAGKRWKAIRIGGDPRQKKIVYFFSRLIFRFSLLIYKTTGTKYCADFAIARSSYYLRREARKHKADLYIGHNLGALPATFKAAKKNKKPCGFDAEDFHRYEVSDNDSDPAVILKKQIEDKYIPQLTYITASSPCISDAYYNLYPNKLPQTILNVFPVENELEIPAINNNGNLRLFWFSQIISLARGVNDCLDALKLINDRHIELHLLGFLTDEIKQQILSIAGGKITIVFHPPVSPEEIVALASCFDIGLALEDNTPFNRDICLTNKIFTYIQAGLAVIASDTTAQKQLLADYPETGQLYEKGNAQLLANTIMSYNNDRTALLNAKKAASYAARTALNWERESEKFLQLIKETLSV